MSIRKYIAYLRTVETGSFTQAANELGYTHSDGMVLLPTIREIVKD